MSEEGKIFIRNTIANSNAPSSMQSRWLILKKN
jgi:hypothetical protein